MGLIQDIPSCKELVERIVRVPVGAEVEIVKPNSLRENSSEPRRAGEPSYLALRNQALAGSIDALPASRELNSDFPTEPSYLEMRDLLLESRLYLRPGTPTMPGLLRR